MSTRVNPMAIDPEQIRLQVLEELKVPEDVQDVIKDIHKLMMNENGIKIKGKRGNQKKPVPNMYKDFICSKVLQEKKDRIIKLAGKGYDNCSCFNLIIPLFMQPYHVQDDDGQFRWFSWSKNVISFSYVPKKSSGLAVVTIHGRLVNVKDPSTHKRSNKFLSVSDSADMKELASKPTVGKFLESPLVVNHPDGRHLLSSYKMTISWLRSRLDRALSKYKEIEKEVEVIPTIKQKEGGPLLLHLKIERADGDKMNTSEHLFNIYPAFRVSPCYLAIPLVNYLDRLHVDTPAEFREDNNENDEAKHCLWKMIISSCNHHSSIKHKEPNITTRVSIADLTAIPKVEGKPKKQSAKDKTMYKESIIKPKPMTPTQRKHCEECLDPASRMLLEYYYQYGYIPEDEMNEAELFVTDILNFFKKSLDQDCKPNDPKIIDFVKSGSVAEKLKVVKPDEFDVMIQIDLPKSTECYNFVPDESFPTGYVICKVKPSHTFSRGLQRCFRKSDKFGHCIAPDKLAFSWLYGRLERAINKYKREFPNGANLKLRQSGPALLLEIIPPASNHSTLPRVISVDLVLALKLSDDDCRYAVAKRATEEQLYHNMITKQQSLEPENGQETRESNPPAEATITTDQPPSCVEIGEAQTNDKDETPTVDGNETQIVDVGKTQMVDRGGTWTFDVGETQTVDVGETQRVDKDETQTVDVGETEMVYRGKTWTFDAGETRTVDVSGTQMVDKDEKQMGDVGETQTVDVGETQMVDGGGTQTVDVGENQTVYGDVNWIVDSGETQPSGEIELARKNLKFLWRISYSNQERQYLEYVKQKQKEQGVEGCQNICLMILKTVCTREILKKEDESVLYREVSSYILKTALFHVLAKSDLVHDWKIDCLANRYVDLLNQLSEWKNLPHFFFGNASQLKVVFPEDSWCEETGSKNLLEELHATLRLQLLMRFSQIVDSFTAFKKKIDENYASDAQDGESSSERSNCDVILRDMLNGKSPEEVIHPPFTKAGTRFRKSRKALIDKQAEDSQVREAAKAERKTGPYSNAERNLTRPQEHNERQRQPRNKFVIFSVPL